MSALQSNMQYQDHTFKDQNLDRTHVEATTFLDCKFLHCSMVEAVLQSCRFQRCEFVGCDLSLVDIQDSLFASVEFEESKLVGIDWTKALKDQPQLGKPLSFKASILNHATFIGLGMQAVQIIDCVAHEADFRQANFSQASFVGTDLKGSLFGETILQAADLRSARNFHIDPAKNTLTDARFSLPEAMSLLYALDIELDDGGSQV